MKNTYDNFIGIFENISLFTVDGQHNGSLKLNKQLQMY